MRSILPLLLLAATGASGAQELACEYTSMPGDEIEIREPRSYVGDVALDFSPYKDFSATVSVSELRGRKAKVVGPTTGDVRTNLELVMEDCGTIFMRDDDGRLLSNDFDRLKISAIRYAANRASPWHVEQKIDPVDDRKSCSIQTYGSLPSPFFVWTQGEFAVGALGADFPGRPVFIRVDSNPAIHSNGRMIRGEAAQRVMRQVRAGATAILAAGYEWPNDFRVSSIHATDGLAERFDECERYMR